MAGNKRIVFALSGVGKRRKAFELTVCMETVPTACKDLSSATVNSIAPRDEAKCPGFLLSASMMNWRNSAHTSGNSSTLNFFRSAGESILLMYL